MKPVAVIEGIPRGMATFNKNPSEDLLKKVKNARKTTRFYSPAGIVGYPGSGRKTLAYRFQRISRSEPLIEEVPVYGIYGHDFYVKLENRRGFRFLVKFYIIDPRNMCHRSPPLSLESWNEFCCMVIVFDITDKKTFKAVPQYLNILRQDVFEIQEKFFIVGNKSDLRRTDEARHTQVSKRSATRMADLLGATYYECCAKQRDSVWPILRDVRRHGMQVRYIEKDFYSAHS